MFTTTDLGERRLDRRAFILRALGLLALAAGGAPRALAEGLRRLAGDSRSAAPSNFRRVYMDERLRDRFFLFLQNVYRILPEDRFHQLIIDLCLEHETDQEIYEALLRGLPAITPLLSELTYALPALKSQREEMGRQTAEFLGSGTVLKGYLEIGSTGRYVGALRRRLKLQGPVYVINDMTPSYSISDMFDRAAMSKIGRFIPMDNYDPFDDGRIPERSLDLVTDFIGLHHCPSDRLEGFVRSIRSVLRPGGRFLLRDHDVDSSDQEALVALAHDVFNAGLSLPWKTNQEQVRLFRSVKDWTQYLEAFGFRRSPRVLEQRNDPTRNLLLEFVRT
ncbi:MAG: class I SAM-dependent methyltransferase [Elusimicrobia bacterium]|nr:class I SAM-dependent methyltransferase [Elusimicrobiota bacterium]